MYQFTYIKRKAPGNRQVHRSVYSCGSAVRNLLHITLPAPKICCWFSQFIEQWRTPALGHYISHYYFFQLTALSFHSTPSDFLCGQSDIYTNWPNKFTKQRRLSLLSKSIFRNYRLIPSAFNKQFSRLLGGFNAFILSPVFQWLTCNSFDKF